YYFIPDTLRRTYFRGFYVPPGNRFFLPPLVRGNLNIKNKKGQNAPKTLKIRLFLLYQNVSVEMGGVSN
ncbi:MAG TPA: hypothetical protein VN370_00040, partial [Desulfitobacteriaceae bacterium]|nr:hypothetical protein [Desulfitobacteriaceae bacterium]